MTGIDQFEALVRQLVEGTFGRLFPAPVPFDDLVRSLWRTMERERRLIGGRTVVPGCYEIALNPTDYAALRRELGDRFDDDLARCVQHLARTIEAHISGPVATCLAPDSGLLPGQVEVRAVHSVPECPNALQTREMPAAVDQAAEASQWTLRLGQCTYRLGEPVISVGRALSNEIILEDRRVSRRHARLRWHDGRYYLSDTDSREGVSVNGQHVQPGLEWPLTDGDRIGLAGLELVFERDGLTSAETAE